MFLSTSTQQLFSRQWAIAQRYPIPVWRVMRESTSFTFVAGSDSVPLSTAGVSVGDRIVAGDKDYFIQTVNAGSVQLDQQASQSGTFLGNLLRAVLIDGEHTPRCHALGIRERDILGQNIDRVIDKAFVLTVPQGDPSLSYLKDTSQRYALDLNPWETFSVQFAVTEDSNPQLNHKIYLIG